MTGVRMARPGTFQKARTRDPSGDATPPLSVGGAGAVSTVPLCVSVIVTKQLAAETQCVVTIEPADTATKLPVACGIGVIPIVLLSVGPRRPRCVPDRLTRRLLPGSAPSTCHPAGTGIDTPAETTWPLLSVTSRAFCWSMIQTASGSVNDAPMI